MGNPGVVPAAKPDGKSDPKIVYPSTMARVRWRTLYLKAEVTSPTHRASERWLSTAAAELFDVAEVKIKIGGDIKADNFDVARGEEPVTIDLSRDAVLGIKHAVVQALLGQTNNRMTRPAPPNERRELLAACDGIGPDGIFRRLVEKEAKLPEDDDLEEGSELDEMDKKLQPEQKKE